MSERERTLAEWLRAAWDDPAADCPPPESWLDDELAALAPADRERLLAHATSCPACAAERELAAAFDDGAAGVAAADLAWVADRLEAASPVPVARQASRGSGGAAVAAAGGEGATVAAQPAPGSGPANGAAASGVAAATTPEPAAATAGNAAAGTVVPFRGRQPLQRWARLAAAAALVIAAGLTWSTLDLSQEPLPEPPSDGRTVRGSRVAAVAPVGEVAELPHELRWQPVAGAARYRVRLLAVDDSVLWEGAVDAPPAVLPAAAVAALHPAVSYRWTVTAHRADGSELGRSDETVFRATPPPEPAAEPAASLEPPSR